MPDPSNPCEPLSVSVKVTPGEIIVEPDGELDISTAPYLERAFEKAARRGEARVALDLSALSFMDASGLRLIIEANERLVGRLVVRNAQPQVRRIFEITHVGEEVTFEGEDQPRKSTNAEANVELVRRIWEAFRDGGPAALAEVVPDDVDWLPWQARGRVLHGRNELREFWSSENVAVPENASFTAMGDNVVVCCEYRLPGGGHKAIWSVYRFEGRTLTQAASFDQKVEALTRAA